MSIIEQIKAEIERRVKNPNLGKMTRIELQHLLSSIDTFKEEPVDLEKELEDFVKTKIPYGEGGYGDYMKIARHFYELGRNAK